MSEIIVEGRRTDDGWRFKVTVKAEVTTTHTVDVPMLFYQDMTAGKIMAKELVEKSFGFLLEREPNTSILARFELPVIGRYFPEYGAFVRGLSNG